MADEIGHLRSIDFVAILFLACYFNLATRSRCFESTCYFGHARRRFLQLACRHRLSVGSRRLENQKMVPQRVSRTMRRIHCTAFFFPHWRPYVVVVIMKLNYNWCREDFFRTVMDV